MNFFPVPTVTILFQKLHELSNIWFAERLQVKSFVCIIPVWLYLNFCTFYKVENHQIKILSQR